jgi:hypothetical protein
MKKCVATALVAFAIGVMAFAAEKTLDQLKAEVSNAKLQDQPRLYSSIATLEMDQAESLFSTNDAQKGLGVIATVTADCESAAKSAIDSHKRLKETEIALRKISDRMDTLSKSVEFESRAPIKAASDRVDQARNNLLNAMFKKK